MFSGNIIQSQGRLRLEIDIFRHIRFGIWGYSSVGQSTCLASRGSSVRIRLSPPYKSLQLKLQTPQGYSSVGQSAALIRLRSMVRDHLPLPQQKSTTKWQYFFCCAQKLIVLKLLFQNLEPVHNCDSNLCRFSRADLSANATSESGYKAERFCLFVFFMVMMIVSDNGQKAFYLLI